MEYQTLVASYILLKPIYHHLRKHSRTKQKIKKVICTLMYILYIDGEKGRDIISASTYFELSVSLRGRYRATKNGWAKKRES